MTVQQYLDLAASIARDFRTAGTLDTSEIAERCAQLAQADPIVATKATITLSLKLDQVQRVIDSTPAGALL